MDRQKIILSSKHMGGEFTFQIFPGTFKGHGEIEKIAQLAFDEVDRIENLLTDFRASPFSEINKFAGQRPVEVNDEILTIIEDSLLLSEETGGAFDISFASMGQLWREHKGRGTKPSSLEMSEASKYINYKNIEIDKENKTVFLPHEKMKIGLGGIGKGYAVDKAFELLRRYGLSNFYINGSGDIRVHSRVDAPRAWNIGVRNPFSKDASKSCAYFKITNGSLATSGVYNNFIYKLGTDFHHIINPVTASSTKDLVSVTVFDETAQRTDTMATSVMIMGKKRGLEYLNEKKVNSFIIDEAGTVHHSEKSLNLMEKQI